MTVGLNIAAIQALMLVSVRLVAFLTLAPPFSYKAFPATVRMMLALGIALAVQSGTPVSSGDLEVGPFVLAIILEVVVGAFLGFLVYLVFIAVSAAGSLLDQMGGFAMASAFDPLNQTQNTPLGQFFQMTTLALLFASGGHTVILAGLVRTFDLLPLGTGFSLAGMGNAATTQLTQLFVVAVQIAGPLLIVLLLSDVGLGLLTRVAPALNAFAMGFPLKIYLTLALGALLYLTLPGVVGSLLSVASKVLTGAVS